MKIICRLCLESGARFNIFYDNSTIHEKLLSYCKLKIHKDDGLPEHVCNYCVEELDRVVTFIDKCEESDKLLRNDTIKTEIDEIVIKKENQVECSFEQIKPEEFCNDDFISDTLDTKDCVKNEIDDDNKPLIINTNLQQHIPKDLKINKARTTEESEDLSDDSQAKRKSIKKSSNDRSRKKRSISNNIKFLDNILLKISHDTTIRKNGAKLVAPANNEKPKIVRKNVVSKLKKDPASGEEPSVTNDEQKLRKSKRSVRMEDESSVCSFCGLFFTDSRGLKRHLRKHSGDKHKCGKCPKTFSTRELMKEHEQRHFQTKGFPCEECGNMFFSKCLSRKHYVRVHQRAFATPCKICDRVLSTPRGLREHMKIHTGEKNYECQICQRKFAHSISLTCHLRVHTGEQPYACRFCDKRFSIGKSLREHERLHTGEKPYVCPICPKRFEQLSNMKSHFKYNHKGLDFKKTQELKRAVSA